MTTERMPRAIADAVIARAGGLCEALTPGVCTTRGQHLHHRQLRSRGGKHTVPNLVLLCTACHTHLHLNVTEATERGLIVSTYADPADVPAVRYGYPCQLHDDGTVTTIIEEN